MPPGISLVLGLVPLCLLCPPLSPLSPFVSFDSFVLESFAGDPRFIGNLRFIDGSRGLLLVAVACQSRGLLLVAVGC